MNKMGKRKLKLNALIGDVECFLEIERVENGDFYVEMRGQNTKKEIHNISAQVPNPINGGGNLDNYKTLRQIYEVLKK